MTNCTDERVLQARRQIGSEMMQYMYYFILISFCIKIIYFDMDLRQCITEYIIMIAAPLYQAWRSRSLGVVLGDYRKASKASALISVAIGLCVLLFSLGGAAGRMAKAEDIVAIVSFVIAFSLARFGFAHIEKRRAEKLAKKYDEE